MTMARFLHLPDGRMLTVEQTVVEVSTMGGEQRDPDWTFTDSHGHEHRADSTAGPVAYPTLRYVVDQEDYTDEDGEEYPGWGHWECIQCGDEIEPGTKYIAGGPAFAPGVTRYSVDGQPITEAEAQTLIDSARP